MVHCLGRLGLRILKAANTRHAAWGWTSGFLKGGRCLAGYASCSRSIARNCSLNPASRASRIAVRNPLFAELCKQCSPIARRNRPHAIARIRR